VNHPSRIIVIGASAGGIEALKDLVRQLPGDLPAAVFVVVHSPAQGPNLLASILDRCGPITALDAADGRPIRAGHIYVGLPDRHLLIEDDIMRLTRGPRENRFRPAIDTLFRSAAYSHGPRVVGVVLTGQLDDGTSGLWAIKDRGGVAVVQAPHDAQYPSMPLSALRNVEVDHVVELMALPGLLVQLARENVLSHPSPEATIDMRTENKIAAGANSLQAGALSLGKPSSFTCPECHGVLSEVREGPIVRFRCHTGHAFSMQTLLADADEAVDAGFWGVLRALQERCLLLRDAAALARERDALDDVTELLDRAADCERKADVIRGLLQEPLAPAKVANTRQRS
jgi:two-component system chemotaxis response regulator CheB